MHPKVAAMKSRTIPILLILAFLCCPHLVMAAPAPVPERGRHLPAPPTGARLNEVLNSLELYAEKARQDWKVPGMAIAVVHEDEVVYSHGFGLRRISKPEPVTPRTRFQIGSTSKAFTTALMGMLVDQGRFTWDDRLVDRLPGFRMHDPWVTREFRVGDLVEQHSGMPAHALDILSFLGYGRRHIIDAIRFVKPTTSFRAKFAYQNCLFLVAAELIEKMTGKTWEESVRTRIFEPLGMRDTVPTMEGYWETPDVATPHTRRRAGTVALDRGWPAEGWLTVYAPAGGIGSNVLDMAQWLRLQMHDGTFEGRRILAAGTMESLHRPVTYMGKPSWGRSWYCKGWAATEHQPARVVWHNGGTTGMKTMVGFVPEARVGIVVLSNLGDTGLPEAVAFRFFDLWFGRPPRDWAAEALAQEAEGRVRAQAASPTRPSPPAPPLALEKYAGGYSNEACGKMEVVCANGNLALVLGPGRVHLPLRPWNRDTFAVDWPDLADGAGLVTFRLDPSGVPASLSLDLLEREGLQVFDRIPPEQTR